MAKKVTGPQILTANLLSDGMVVYLSPDGTWRGNLENAHIAHTDDGVAELEAGGAHAVQRNIVVDPYLIEIEATGGPPVPVAFRERMRTNGPSVNLDFNARTNGHAAHAG